MTGASASQKVEKVEVTIQQESYHPPLTFLPLLGLKFKEKDC